MVTTPNWIRNRFFQRFLLLTILWLTLDISILFYPPVWAALHPNHLVILANENDPDSLSVARHYAEQRDIPSSHIIKLDLPLKETIRWEDYRERLAEPLKSALLAKQLSTRTRVIVTTYGIPLRLTGPQQSDQEKVWHADAIQWRNAAVAFLRDINRALHEILNAFQNKSLPSRLPSSDAIAPIGAQPQKILDQIDRSITKIKQQLRKQPHSPILEELKTSFFKQVLQLEGASAYRKNSEVHLSLPERISSSPYQFQAHLELAQQLLPILTYDPSTQHRDWAYQLAQRYFGIRGVYRLATLEQKHLAHKDAAASVDSELSLLWLDREEYSTHWRTPNPLYAWHHPNSNNARKTLPFPILMVSRIDAPTPDLAKRIIDKALMAEQMGLSGKVYLDARGLKPKQALGYGDYDQSLRNLGTFLQEITSYPVILENTQKRFQEPGEAPEVAVYAGWYRLRHYEDAFSFNPGAIGFHMASGEAISIHKSKEKGWCKNALERGITVTIGPTSEPYLDSFPKPSEFFGLLLSGRYSLVEAYYLSLRHVSWRMVLFGDPLYNPWKGVSLATVENLERSIPEFRKFHILPTAPSTLVFPDPTQSAKTRRTQKSRIMSQIPTLLNYKY